MTINDLISRLQELRNQHGDLPVFVYGTEWTSPYTYDDAERTPSLEIYPSTTQLEAGVPKPVRLLISMEED
jgi:hypothetical protein